MPSPEASSEPPMGGWAASHALILAPVAHPAAVRVSSHVAPVLSLPVAVHRADTVATIPFVDLVDAVVAVPATVRVHASVASDLSAVTILVVRLKAGEGAGAIVRARSCC